MRATLFKLAALAAFVMCLAGFKLNSDVTLFASAARTTLQDSADQVNNNTGATVTVYLNVTAASGTGGLTIRIEGKNSLGTYFYLNAAPTAIAGTGQYIYVLGPGATSTGGSVTQATAVPLPRTWRVEIAVGDASSYTYTVAASVS